MNLAIVLIRKTVLISCVTVMLSACASGGREIPESKKDASGQYDGLWIARVQKAVSPQSFGSRSRVTCSGDLENITLMVTGSEMKVKVLRSDGNKEFSTFVDTKGNFRLKFPSGIVFSSRTSSGTHLSPSEALVILTGNLSEGSPTGTHVLGLPSFGYRGCTSKVSFNHY